MTQKEYTGPEFEIEFARAWLAYVEGGKVGVDPHDQWESYQPIANEWKQVGKGRLPEFDQLARYRWKPQPKRMVTIGYASGGGAWQSKELVAPEVEAPKDGGECFYIDFCGKVESFRYHNGNIGWGPSDVLAAGNLFLTREDAQAMADWLAICRKGGQS